jgi:hypothetical protein
MATVMIGVDPRKGSHTAVAIGPAEEPLGQLRVRVSAEQAERLVAWVQAWPDRTWAVEGAAGLGYLLAQQLVAIGERVLDVPPKLAARVRLLQAGDTNKNDPNDALSAAVAALRSKAARPVLAEDHAVVLKIWAKRHRDLARARNQAPCRLHAVLCDLVPGGIGREITAAKAGRILGQVTPPGAVAEARCQLAAEFLADIRRLDAQLRDTKKKLTAAVKASRTSLTEVFGVGPVSTGAITWPPGPKWAWQSGRLPASWRAVVMGTLASCSPCHRWTAVVTSARPKPHDRLYPQQVGGHDRDSLPVALLQVLDQDRLGTGAGQHALGGPPVGQPPGLSLAEPLRIAARGAGHHRPRQAAQRVQ